MTTTKQTFRNRRTGATVVLDIRPDGHVQVYNVFVKYDNEPAYNDITGCLWLSREGAEKAMAKRPYWEGATRFVRAARGGKPERYLG